MPRRGFELSTDGADPIAATIATGDGETARCPMGAAGSSTNGARPLQSRQERRLGDANRVVEQLEQARCA